MNIQSFFLIYLKRFCTFLLSALLTVMFFIPGIGRAELCLNKSEVFNGNINYRICGVPDLDQQRAADEFVSALPNDGRNYCVPTSTMNWFVYIANHGWPSLAPGPGNWGPEPPLYSVMYETMTSYLALLGYYMQTDPDDGTKSNNAAFGTRIWLNASGLVEPLFVVSNYTISEFITPRFDMVAAAAASGRLVVPRVGWYKNFDDLPQYLKDLYDTLGINTIGYYRDGGHAMSLVMANTDTHEIGLNNPAGGKPYTSQSAFNMQPDTVQWQQKVFNGVQRVLDKFMTIGGYLDGYMTITPLYALVVNNNTFHFIKPIQLSSDSTDEKPLEFSFSTEHKSVIKSVAMHPAAIEHPYIVENDNTIYQINELTGESTVFARVDNPQDLVFGGPNQSLFVLTPEFIISLDTGGGIVKRIILENPLEAITYDSVNNQLVGLARARDSLVLLSSDLSALRIIPLDMDACDNKINLATDPASATIIVHCAGSTVIHRIDLQSDNVIGGTDLPTTQIIPLIGAISPGGLSVDDSGHIYLSDNGVIHEFTASGRELTDSPFAGRTGGEIIDIFHAFDNYDLATMDGPHFRDVLPDDAFPCPGSDTGKPDYNESCTLAQICSCDASWKNHGEFVACMAKATTKFYESGLISKQERQLIISNSARSECGRKESTSKITRK